MMLPCDPPDDSLPYLPTNQPWPHTFVNYATNSRTLLLPEVASSWSCYQKPIPKFLTGVDDGTQLEPDRFEAQYTNYWQKLLPDPDPPAEKYAPNDLVHELLKCVTRIDRYCAENNVNEKDFQKLIIQLSWTYPLRLLLCDCDNHTMSDALIKSASILDLKGELKDYYLAKFNTEKKIREFCAKLTSLPKVDENFSSLQNLTVQCTKIPKFIPPVADELTRLLSLLNENEPIDLPDLELYRSVHLMKKWVQPREIFWKVFFNYVFNHEKIRSAFDDFTLCHKMGEVSARRFLYVRVWNFMDLSEVEREKIWELVEAKKDRDEEEVLKRDLRTAGTTLTPKRVMSFVYLRALKKLNKAVTRQRPVKELLEELREWRRNYKNNWEKRLFKKREFERRLLGAEFRRAFVNNEQSWEIQFQNFTKIQNFLELEEPVKQQILFELRYVLPASRLDFWVDL